MSAPPFMPNVRANPARAEVAEGETLPPDPDPLADVPEPPPEDDGLAADDPAHAAEEPPPPDEGDADAEEHPVDEPDLGGEG